MAYAEASVLLEGSLPEIFKFILDGENNKLWRPAVMDIHKLSGEPIGVGTVFIQGIRGPNGIRINADYEIIKYDEDKKFSFQVLNGPYRAIGTFCFELQEKGTKVTFTMTEISNLSEVERNRHLQNVVDAVANLKAYFH